MKEKFRSYGYIETHQISHQIKCSNCNNDVGAHEAGRYSYTSGHQIYFVICPICSFGSVIEFDGSVYPTVPYGDPVEGLPKELESAYNEARNVFSINAFTSCQLICRKILMHIAIDKCKSDEGKTFVEYIDALVNKKLITPLMKPWVDKIRQEGNDATHKLESPSKDDAENILNFTTQLLKTIYEMEVKMNKFNKQTSSAK